MQWKDWMESCLTMPWVEVLTMAKRWVDVLTLTKAFAAVMLPSVEDSLTKPWVENMVFAAVLTNFS